MTEIIPTILLFMYSTLYLAASSIERPNIVIILADDLGFNDVSFRGSDEFLTPNIDALAYNGAILNHYYVPAMCTPSRAALLTGKYPINTGMQHYVISNDEPWSLPSIERTMAEVFHDAGYKTCLVGKWHLGFSKSNYTPTRRGFDVHYGYLGAYIDYNEHFLYDNVHQYKGHDMRDNLNVSDENTGRYATDIFTGKAVDLIRAKVDEQPLFMVVSHLAPHTANLADPLQAPQIEIEKFSYISDKNRRIYAAMVSKMDESVGRIIGALDSRGILNETIVIFYSDNGAPILGENENSGSNYPLRGQKKSPWEGGIRSSGVIWSPDLLAHGTVLNQTIYAADWLPTLAAAAHINLNPAIQLDGLNLLPQIVNGSDIVEREIMHNIDDISGYVSYSSGQWKYINGTTENGLYDGWLGNRSKAIDPRTKNYANIIRSTSVWKSLSAFVPPQTIPIDIENIRRQATISCGDESKRTGKPCNPLQTECLFNLPSDPCEQNNLYDELKDSVLLANIKKKIQTFRKNAKPPANRPTDPRCNPKFYNDEWTWWEDEARNNRAETQTAFVSYLFLAAVFYF